MKKTTAIYFVICALTTSNYTYGMFRFLTKKKPTNQPFTQRRTDAHGVAIYGLLIEQHIPRTEEQHKIAQELAKEQIKFARENNILLRMIFKQNVLHYEMIQDLMANGVLYSPERNQKFNQIINDFNKQFSE